jgi:hypothetical protein
VPEDVDVWALADLATPWCLRVAVTLRIAELLADGPRPVADLAEAAGADPRRLDRVLRHLTTRGVFTLVEPDSYALNAAAGGLLHPTLRVGLGLDGIGGRMAGVWSGLLASVRGGRTAFAEVFGRDFWADLDAHEDIADSFDALMGPAGHGEPDADLELSGGWDDVRTVVDVGGGSGGLLAALLVSRPALTGTLVDLPRAATSAEKTFRLYGLSERASTVAGSFFDRLPSGADVYLLSKVIGDWPDPEVTAILRRCAEAAGPSGRVLVLGGVAPEPVTDDVLMMALLDGGGRTLPAFEELATRAGLRVVDAGVQRSGRYVVELHPAGEVLSPGAEVTVLLRKSPRPDLRYPATVLDDDGTHLAVRAPWVGDGSRDFGFVRFETGDIFTEHYWRDRWFSVKEVRDHADNLKGWYCDVCRPVVVHDGVVEAADLDLDLWVSADGSQVLRLDEDEFLDSGLSDQDPAAAASARAALDELDSLARDRFAAILD